MMLKEAGTAGVATTNLAHPSSSATTYNTPTTLTSSLTMPSACAAADCRFIIKASADSYYDFFTTGFQLDIDSTTQTPIIDEANNVIILKTTGNALAAAAIDFEWSGSNVLTWTIEEEAAPAGSFEVTFSTANDIAGEWNIDFTDTPPTYTTDTYTGISLNTCNTFYGENVGSGDHLECQIDIPLTSTAYTIEGVQVHFTNPGSAEFDYIHHNCEAYIQSGGATVATG
mmetsp:Transcript_24192/g.21278  ORF Transcript_24192/g.21278 Transcript_24192/m.21278 type:complete len:228 (+) Transcript_24192:2355-3038(+)